ncbi:MAG: putative branched-chain amino acid permease (azaleucine resistance) [Haloquadratum sp. J07HQX50]|nr:MAG: putative branched-chain amino acid permease (azaleucine resistance) [Haloquadratum sp. J07HQX50]
MEDPPAVDVSGEFLQAFENQLQIQHSDEFGCLRSGIGLIHHVKGQRVLSSRLPPEIARGIRDVSPILLGIIPFGLVSGVAAIEAGLTPVQAMGLSVFVFAGTSQLAVIDLLAQNAALSVTLLTGVVINLRMLMYSASIAPSLQSIHGYWKAISAYILTDQSYALAVARYADSDLTAYERLQYYFIVALALWIVWQITTIIGILVGAQVPDAWGLGFAVPLVFLAILVPAITSQPKLAAAIVGGTVAVGGEVLSLPYNLGLIVGGLAGVAAGLSTERILNKGTTGQNDVD